MKTIKILIILAVLVLAIVGTFFYITKNEALAPTNNVPIAINSQDPLNLEYVVDSINVKLVNGKFEGDAYPGAVSKVVINSFGVPVKGDINEDGRDDYALMVTENGGGTGTFYFVVAALADANGNLIGTNSVFLGDRIAPQNIEIRNGEILANYADRKSGEPFTAIPSVGVTKYLQIQNGKLVDKNSPATSGEFGDATNEPVQKDVGALCTSSGGKWDAKYKECTNVSSAICKQIGGNFNECASACRNDPTAQICTMQCVQVCLFK